MQTSGLNITAIPAKKELRLGANLLSQQELKRRVAGYARVSTDSEEQKTSYEAQVDHYTRLINSREDWDFVKVYTDEGISATNIKRRKGFNQMIEDALAGKIDLILTKSISRFARNTVDTLTTVRKLKERGVEVYFEKENIHTLDSSGELFITIMSSLAQEESRSMSENITWGWRKRFADGRVYLNYKRFLGFQKGPDGRPQIVENEAEIIRMIFKRFLQGYSANEIARFLSRSKIPTATGKNTWSAEVILSMLSNEKYKGDALLQKYYTVDFLNKKMKRNQGEVTQYYVKNSHDAIIRPEIFDLAQLELKKRRHTDRSIGEETYLYHRIVCGLCGEYFNPRIQHSNSKYRKTVWMCKNRYTKGGKCDSLTVDETQIQAAFIEAFNKIVDNRKEILDTYTELIRVFSDTSALDKQLEAAEEDMKDATTLLKSCIDENAHNALDQDEYNQRASTYIQRYEDAKSRLDRLNEQRSELTGKFFKCQLFLEELETRAGLMNSFDLDVWYATIDRVVIKENRMAAVVFKGGYEVPVEITKTMVVRGVRTAPTVQGGANPI